MYRITTLCLLVCLSLAACTVGLTEREMLTPSSGVSPTPEPTLSAPTPDEWSTLSPVPPTSAPSPTATRAPQPSATPTTFATSRPTAHSEAPPATATLSPVVLPDHALPKPVTLFKAEGPEVYLVEETTWTHRHIVDWETFLHLGFRQSDIVTHTRFAGYPEGPPITRLLKGAGEWVYWMENGQRRHIPDMETFVQLGHRQEDISEIPDELLVTWPLGEPLPSVLGTPAEPVPPLSQEMAVLTHVPRDRCERNTLGTRTGVG
jgi:hypothetical protein